jgi:glycosyltransferase involved in cell wall biosynthesis
VPCDVVVCHACWPHALFAPVVRRHRLPLIHWVHDVYAGRHWLERRAGRTPPDLVLANSRFTLAAMPAVFPGVPGEVLYLPVPAPALQDRAAVRGRLRAALQTPEDAVVVVQASRLERWKGHTLLLQALAQLKDHPGWVCWVAGGVQKADEQEYCEELRALASRSGLAGRVRFLGQRSDVPELLAAADVYCQPNGAPEPFGVAFVEALHAGLPVVTTALGGVGEIVTEDCGLLVPAGDAGALAEALRRLIEDAGLRARLGEAGPAQAALRCAPGARLEQLRGLLANAARARVVA